MEKLTALIAKTHDILIASIYNWFKKYQVQEVRFNTEHFIGARLYLRNCNNNEKDLCIEYESVHSASRVSDILEVLTINELWEIILFLDTSSPDKCIEYTDNLDKSPIFISYKESNTEETREVPKWIYDKLKELGMLGDEVRKYNVGNSNYSKHFIQPWPIWQDWNLNSWDADIVKRTLRTKEGTSRKEDYEKIIHICKERIRQIDNGTAN